MSRETSNAETQAMPGTPNAQFLFALLRIIVGWHFLYEGWVKLMSSGWSSAGYLKFSTGPFAGLFHWMGSQPVLVRVIDQFNIWGLVLIGLGLMLGVAIRPAALSGIMLLALYYLAYPPFFSPVSGVAEGSYLVVNKNLVELVALAVVMVFPAACFGLGSRFRSAARGEKLRSFSQLPRREMLAACAGLPFLGALLLSILKKHGWKSFEEIQLRGRPGDVTVTSATMKNFQFSSLRDLKGRLPYGKIGSVTLSRMILGGNLIGGWAHARDLIYVSKLVKAYHTRGRIFETFDLAESCGINTVLTSPLLCDAISDYWKSGGKIQFISDCGGGKDVLETIRRSIDRGACACYIHGGIGDRLVEEGNFDVIVKGLDLIRKNGLPAGMGGHKLATIKGCVEKGISPDFWMKTFHRVDYWSARQPASWTGMDWTKPDNIWCESPEEVAAFMQDLPQPWLAYKVLAAGAIEPKTGFRSAFENGADFICVGMYDFQIVDDVNIALDVLNSRLARQRVWRA